MTSRVTSLSMALLFLIGTSVSADELIRKSSAKIIRGDIKKSDKNVLTFKPKVGAELKVPVDDIDRVRFKAEPPALNLARNDERSGRFQRALEAYKKLRTGLSAAARKDVDFLIARAEARIAMADPSKAASAGKQLEAYITANGNGFRYYEATEWLGKLQFANGDFDAAKATFGKLRVSTSNGHKMASQVAIGRIQLAQKDAAGALQSFESVIAANASSVSEVSSRYDAMLGKAQCLTAQSQFDAAVATLSDIIDNTKPEQSDLQARAYLLQGATYLSQDRAKEAVMAFLHVDLLYDRERSAHAESLYHLAQTWGKAGHPERGTDAGQRLRKLYPNNPWTKKLGG